MLIVILILSCTPEFEFQNLLGKWTARDVVPHPDKSQNVESYIEYFTNDSMCIIAILNGDTMQTISGHYKLDKNNCRLEQFVGDTSVMLKIVLLTKSEMELLDVNTNITWRYVRPQ